MKKHLNLIFILFIIGAIPSFAQDQNIYYLSNNGRRFAVADSADYIRVVKPPDDDTGLLNVFEFYTDGKKKLVGKTRYQSAFALEGPFVSYYENGFRRQTGSYTNGAIVGDAYEYFPNGQLYTLKNYGKPKFDQYNISFTQSIKIISCNDSTGKELVVNGNGYYKGYDPTMSYICEWGQVKNGKRTGDWEGDDRAGRFRFRETYSDGQLLNAQTQTDDGKTYTYNKREILPEYPDGMAAFYRYSAMNLHNPNFLARGVAYVSFIVTAQGVVLSPNFENIVGADFIAEAQRIIKKTSPWKPGRHFGIPVTRMMRIPVYFNSMRNQ